MKQSTFFSIIILSLICLLRGNQANASVKQKFNDTITTAPVGTVIKDGKLIVAKGYKIRYSAGGVGEVYRVSDGKVACKLKCEKKCSPCRDDKSLCCCGGWGGGWDGPYNDVAISVGEKAPDGKDIWKVLAIPKTNITTSSN